MKRIIPFLTILALLTILGACSRKPVEKYALLETSKGTVVIDLFEEQTPLHAANFTQLVTDKALNETYFHRIIKGFVAQGGDPNTRNGNRADDGMGGIGERIPAEIDQPHLRGSVGAARDNNPEKKSSGSQFYICLQRLPQLDKGYTVFGKVVKGMEVVDAMAQEPTDERDNPMEPIYIVDSYMVDAADYH